VLECRVDFGVGLEDRIDLGALAVSLGVLTQPVPVICESPMGAAPLAEGRIPQIYVSRDGTSTREIAVSYRPP